MAILRLNIPSSLEGEDLELELLLEALHRTHGFDFLQYSRAHLKRRLLSRMQDEQALSLSHLQHKLLHENGTLERVLEDLSINVTEMFRDSNYFRVIKQQVLPILDTHTKIKIWHAGCSSGEEVYSMAIFLKEAGIYERCTIYATDFNDSILQQAQEAIYPIEQSKQYARAYLAAGGEEDFSDYYSASDNSVIMRSELRERVVFANHNLVTDGSFGAMNLIMCRNVLIYFEKSLQQRVLSLFDDSLQTNGMLCLGSRETIGYTSLDDHYTQIDKKHPIYKKGVHS